MIDITIAFSCELLVQLRLELCAVVTKKRRLTCDLSVSSDRNAQAIRAARVGGFKLHVVTDHERICVHI
jgi:hypothetical protein